MKPRLEFILAICLSTSIVAAEDAHEAWMKYFVGQWTYAWTSEEGEFAEKGELKITPTAKGKGFRTEILTATGDRETEIGGWQPDRKTLFLAGVSSNGGYWHVEYDDVQKEKMSGSGYGALPDGRPWKANLTVTRKSDEWYEIRFDGTAGDEKLVTVSQTKRK